MLPAVASVDSLIESYLNYVYLEYELVLSRMQLHHRMLKAVNDITPKLIETYRPNKTIKDILVLAVQ